MSCHWLEKMRMRWAGYSDHAHPVVRRVITNHGSNIGVPVFSMTMRIDTATVAIIEMVGGVLVILIDKFYHVVLANSQQVKVNWCKYLWFSISYRNIYERAATAMCDPCKKKSDCAQPSWDLYSYLYIYIILLLLLIYHHYYYYHSYYNRHHYHYILVHIFFNLLEKVWIIYIFKISQMKVFKGYYLIMGSYITSIYLFVMNKRNFR